MIENIYNRNDLLIKNNLIRQKQEMSGVDNKVIRKNPYENNKGLYDVKDISDVAKELYSKDKTVQKFKQMVIDMDQSRADLKVNNLIENGKLQFSNDDIASGMLEDSDLIDMLFG